MEPNLEEILKFIESNNITAYQIAKGTDLTENGIQKIIDGKSKNPRKLTLKVIAEYLTSSKNTKQNNQVKQIEVTQPAEVFKTKAGSTYEELTNGRFKLTVPFVPVRAQARYLSDFCDADFISELNSVSFIVDRVGRGRYLAFEIQNDSMDDDSKRSIPDGAIVLGRELGKHHWKDKLKTRDFPYWIIVHKQGMLCKEITAHDVEKGIITCHSLNDSPEYQDFDVKLDDCYQLFNIVKKQI